MELSYYTVAFVTMDIFLILTLKYSFAEAAGSDRCVVNEPVTHLLGPVANIK